MGKIGVLVYFVILVLFGAYGAQDDGTPDPIQQTQTSVMQTQGVLVQTQAALDLIATQTAIVVQQTAIASTQTAIARTQTADAIYQTDIAHDQATVAAIEQTLTAMPPPIIQVFEGLEMVKVPAGCFMMGTDQGDRNERPVHEVCFDEPFWIGRYEVTNAQYGSWGEYRGDNRPYDDATWYEARDFCESRGLRLPTEAEWEYAARGPNNWVYPWGNEFIGQNVVYEGTPSYGTRDVGSMPGGVSWVGAYDMSGNVREWVSSARDPYPYDAHDGREDFDGSGRIVRGSAHYHNRSEVRTTQRDSFLPTFSNAGTTGIRCARSY